MAGSQDTAADPRNAHTLVYLNGAFVPRDEARISIFDAGFSLGDGVWEGLRAHNGRLLFLDAHIGRLLTGAAAIDLDIGLDRRQITAALYATLASNAMTDGVHLRLMVTRGLKSTVNQDPRNALGQPTIVITAEYKQPSPANASLGLALKTSSIRCSGADMFDMRLNSHSRLNLIRALLDAIHAGADEALMLDPHGFVSSCNATNFFAVRGATILTSNGQFCFNGITRANIIALCHTNNIPLQIGDFTMDHAHTADEAFVTGTLGGVTPVRAIDGHPMPSTPGPVTTRLRTLYAALMDSDAAAAPPP
jgi:branched-chain amino acid aminotransferase